MREPFREAAKKQLGLTHTDIEKIMDALWLQSVTPGHEMAANYYVSPLWQLISKEVLLRDGFTCQLCKRDGVVVHHRSYGFDVMAGLNDRKLIALCKPCHHQVHFDGVEKLPKRKWESRLKKLQRRQGWQKLRNRLRIAIGRFI